MCRAASLEYCAPVVVIGICLEEEYCAAHQSWYFPANFNAVLNQRLGMKSQALLRFGATRWIILTYSPAQL